MKRYLAFYGKEYYPNEAMDDFLNDFDSIDVCIKSINDKNEKEDDGDWCNRWGLVYDSVERKYVYNIGNYYLEDE